MANKKFSIGEALVYGWDKFKSNLGFFILLLLLIAAINFVLGVIKAVAKGSPLFSFIVDFVSLLVQLLIGLGLIKITLKLCDDQKPEFSDLFVDVSQFLKFAMASLLYFLAFIGGTLLLVIPGIIFGIKFAFYGYLMVEKNLEPLEALKMSAELTKGAMWNLFLFGLLIMIINTIGLLAIILGLFITIPITLVASALVYRKLLAQTESL
ncbi:MAG: hypothetical protein HQ564_07125 [Candidatus Saganbacteria bacterium]|nr:hypothetical protein [Candidatus Saganbacteria bacterium]